MLLLASSTIYQIYPIYPIHYQAVKDNEPAGPLRLLASNEPAVTRLITIHPINLTHEPVNLMNRFLALVISS